MSEYLSKSMRLGILEQTAWGTAKTLADTFIGVPAIPGTIKVNPMTNVEEAVYTSSDTIYGEANRTIINNAGVLPSIEFECYATAGITELLFRAALHTESGSAPTLISPTDAIIDFPADEGILFTVVGYTQAGDTFKLDNAVVDTITFSMSNVSSGEARQARLSVTIFGTNMDVGQTFTGSVSSPVEYILNNGDTANSPFTLDLTSGEDTFTDFCWRKYSLTISNNISSDCFSGLAANNLKRSNPTIEHTFDIPYNDATDDLMVHFTSGAAVSFTLVNGYTLDTALYYCKFQDAGLCYHTAPPTSTEGDYVSNTINLREYKSGTWQPLLTINSAGES